MNKKYYLYFGLQINDARCVTVTETNFLYFSQPKQPPSTEFYIIEDSDANKNDILILKLKNKILDSFDLDMEHIIQNGLIYNYKKGTYTRTDYMKSFGTLVDIKPWP